jgi:hypothetical protein
LYKYLEETKFLASILYCSSVEPSFNEIFTRSIEDEDDIFMNILEHDAVISTSKNATEVYINYRDEGETKE